MSNSAASPQSRCVEGSLPLLTNAVRWRIMTGARRVPSYNTRAFAMGSRNRPEVFARKFQRSRGAQQRLRAQPHSDSAPDGKCTKPKCNFDPLLALFRHPSPLPPWPQRERTREMWDCSLYIEGQMIHWYRPSQKFEPDVVYATCSRPVGRPVLAEADILFSVP